MRPLAVLSLVAVAGLVPGCLGGLFGESRSDWAYDATQLDAAASLGRTGKGVTVAILDTGINVGHPALDHLVDSDRSNGQLVAFKDFLGDADTVAQAFDEDGHGTHVAGIIAARGGSGGVAGIDLRGGSPGVLLVVARVCAGDACDGTVLDDAVRWATAQGANIISMSLGGDAGGDLFGLVPRPLEDAVNAAIDQGIVVIASAGNEGPSNNQDEDALNDDVQFPSSIPGVIAVGAVGRNGHVADFSSRGDGAANPCRSFPFPLPSGGRCAPDQKPEVVAPGVEIISAWTGDGYAAASGTSQATPFMTSAVALLIEGRNLSDRADVQAVKQALVDTAQPVSGQVEPHDDAAGYGRVQARDALRTYAGV